jgi:hypothetical protein
MEALAATVHEEASDVARQVADDGEWFVHVVQLNPEMEGDVLLLMGRKPDQEKAESPTWDVRVRIATYSDGKKMPKANPQPENEAFLPPFILG